jgi:predicted ribosome quality control (RQC) complex YloA/Tae2 family protein
MKTISIYFPEIKKEINYLIGTNAYDNFHVIDESLDDDLWFHSKEHSSSHVVCLLPNDLELNVREKQLLIKKGAELCVFNTKKLTLLYKIPVIYTEIKNIKKTKIAGLVKAINYQTIFIDNFQNESNTNKKKFIKMEKIKKRNN